jgi:hypothetical protein
VDWSGLIVGALLGLIVSLAFWWVQYRVLVPRLEFGSQIRKLTSINGPVYSIKVQNVSRWRTVIDVSFQVRLYLGHGVVEYNEGPVKTLQSLDLRVVPDSVMRIQPGHSQLLRLDLRKTTWSEAPPGHRTAAGIDEVSTADVPLEVLLDRTPAPYVRALVLAYDEVTGSRKFFRSGEYLEKDIKRGRFSGLDVREYSAEGQTPSSSSSDGSSEASD